MPNPVAEVVERLRQNARNLADGTDFHNGRQLGPKDTLYWQAADLIERLSREVPEGFCLVPNDVTEAMTDAFCPRNGSVGEFDFPAAYHAMLSAAPQPPTVSGWQCKECGCRTYAIVDEKLPGGGFAPGNDKRCVGCKLVEPGQRSTGEAPRDWVIRKNGYFYRANRSGYTQEIVAAGLYTEAEATAEARIDPRCISAHRASEFTANMPDMVSNLTRERDQAREALEEISEHPGPHADEAAHWRADLAKRTLAKIRSEEKA